MSRKVMELRKIIKSHVTFFWDFCGNPEYGPQTTLSDKNLFERKVSEFWSTHWGWDKMAAIFKCISLSENL